MVYHLTRRNELAAQIAAQRVALAKIQKTHQGKGLDFDQWPYLEEIYRDPNPEIYIMSSVKSGKSEFLIADGMATCIVGLNVLHCFPDLAIRNRFVQARVDPTILETAAYRSIVGKGYYSDGKNTNSKSLKKVLKSFWNFIGTQKKTAFFEYAADKIITDEEDLCSRENLAYASDRMDWSELKAWVRVGNPTIKNHGIDALYHLSDQKRWRIRCRNCDEWQELDFFKNVINVLKDDEGKMMSFSLRDKNHRCLCQFCGDEINRLEGDPNYSHWEAQAESHISGYHISQLFSPRVSIKELWDQLQIAKDDIGRMQIFYNSKLGIPSEPVGSALTEATMARCEDNYRMPSFWNPGSGMVIAGIDVGAQFHIRISDVENGSFRRAKHIGTCTGWANLTDLMKRFNVKLAVIDAGPETQAAIEWQALCNFDVWRCDHNVSDTNIREPQLKDDERIVSVARTAFYDRAFEAWRKRRHALPIDWRDINGGDYLKQMTKNTRYLDYDARKRPLYRWTDSKPDHAWSADAFDEMACYVASIHNPHIGDVYSTGKKRSGIGAEW